MKVAVGSKCTEFIEEELQCGSSPSNSTLSFAMKESQMEDEVEEEPQPAPWREQTDEELEIQQGLRALAEEAPAAFAVGPGEDIDEKLRAWIAATQRLLDYED